MKKQSAFTLIELVITLAIIAILATAGILGYTDYTRKSRDTARAEIARNLNSSVMAYAASNDGKPPANDVQFEAFLANAGETFGGGGSFLLVDPVGGRDVCLDAELQATQPCRFDYTAYEDGTYAISYGVEHTSSTEENFYRTARSVVDAEDSPKEKYGVYIGSAPFIGSTPTMHNTIPVWGADEEYIPIGPPPRSIPMVSFAFRRNRIDTPVVISGGGSDGWTISNLSDWSPCTAASQCAGHFCVNSVCSDGSMGSICNTIDDCTGINHLSPPWTSYGRSCFNGFCACSVPCIVRVDPD